jgi:endonuclease/exonuclease/phosphatase family metal-dependent hydrolase
VDFGPAAFTVVSYNLGGYGLRDRDGDGIAAEPKPLAERTAALDAIARLAPDVLLVQELGGEESFREFQEGLRRRGLRYRHTEYAARENAEDNAAAFSRFPIARRGSVLDEAYSISNRILRCTSGLLDIDVEPRPGRRVRLMSARLKSRAFHEAGQTEMRRNEARLLGQHVRRALRDDADVCLLVAGTLNDDPDSAPLREVRGPRGEWLSDLRPVDDRGASWTCADPTRDAFERIDYLLASPALARLVEPSGVRIAVDPSGPLASPHRPLVATFRCPPPAATPPPPAPTPPAEN